MGTMNLLDGSFEGKVGQVYGAKQNGTVYCKAIPFSHAPHNEAQKSCFRAFGCLTRFCKEFVQPCKNLLFKVEKNMSPFNSCTKFFKPLISNRIFDLSKMVDMALSPGRLSIDVCEYSEASKEVTLKASLSSLAVRSDEAKIVCGLVLDNGKSFKVCRQDGQSFEASHILTLLPPGTISCIAFSMERLGKHWFLSDAAVGQLLIKD